MQALVEHAQHDVDRASAAAISSGSLPSESWYACAVPQKVWMVAGMPICSPALFDRIHGIAQRRRPARD